MAMKSHVVSKKQTQSIIRDLRNNDYTVDKIDGGYVCMTGEKLIFKAMMGAHGYLCRFNKEFFKF